MKNTQNTFKIGSLTFPEYVAKRLVKDGLGYVPAKEWEDGRTDCKTYIQAILPTSGCDFLVYAHELGHCKTKQRPMAYAYFMDAVCEGRLYNEFTAWDWALRYVSRIGINLQEDDLENAFNHSLATYLKKSEHIREYAHHLVAEFIQKWGTRFKFLRDAIPKPSYNKISTTSIDGFFVDECGTIDGQILQYDTALDPQRNKKWKPWHDIVEKKNREWYRHTKNFF